MANTAAAAKKKAPATKKAGKKTTGNEPVVVDTPPPKKKQRTAPTRFSINTLRGHTVNPYAQGNKNKIDIVLHEGGVPPKDAQPQVTLLPGGRMVSIQWKADERLFSHLQASVQNIKPDTSRYIGYSDTMQLMVNAGVRAVEGYHRGTPQLIQLDVECTGNPKVKMFHVPTKQKVTFQGKAHMQFNCMYVCTLRVANDRHGLTAQPKNAGIADFGFLDSAEADRGGGGNGGDSGVGGGGGGGGGGGAPYASNSESDSDSDDTY